MRANLPRLTPLLLSLLQATAQITPVTSPEPDWPQWRGPSRNGISTETNLLQSWPTNGPIRLWTATSLGNGYSAPIIVQDHIYITGDINDSLHVFALNLSGQITWQTTNGNAWHHPYPGARAACTYSEGRLYHLNAHGRIACLDAHTGQELWAFYLHDRFGGKPPTWALSECLLVHENQVFVTPGGTRAVAAALDKLTGETLWTSPPLKLGPSPSPEQQRLPEPAGEIDGPSYASPLLFLNHQQPTLITCSQRHILAIHAKTGQLLWSQPLKTRYDVIAATPVLANGNIFITAPDTDNGGLLLHPGNGSSSPIVQTLWTTRLDTCHGGIIHLNNHLYGSWYRRNKGWAAVNLDSGEIDYSLHDLPKGSITYANNRLYVLSENGEAALLQPTPTSFVNHGQFKLTPERVSDAWTHPVILHGRLYLRYHESLHCFDVRNTPKA
ncbi:MAG: PQQ-binding-like beta-propeller repeat protein [Limisphaerales bacterium]